MKSDPLFSILRTEFSLLISYRNVVLFQSNFIFVNHDLVTIGIVRILGTPAQGLRKKYTINLHDNTVFYLTFVQILNNFTRRNALTGLRTPISQSIILRTATVFN